MVNKYNLILWFAILMVLTGLVILTFFPNMIYAFTDSGKSGNPDICSPPEGISIENWKIHMSHHPDIYKDCLQ